MDQRRNALPKLRLFVQAKKRVRILAMLFRFMKMNAQQKRINPVQLFMTPLMRTSALLNMSGEKSITLGS